MRKTTKRLKGSLNEHQRKMYRFSAGPSNLTPNWCQQGHQKAVEATKIRETQVVVVEREEKGKRKRRSFGVQYDYSVRNSEPHPQRWALSGTKRSRESENSLPTFHFISYSQCFSPWKTMLIIIRPRTSAVMPVAIVRTHSPLNLCRFDTSPLLQPSDCCPQGHKGRQRLETRCAQRCKTKPPPPCLTDAAVT